MYLLFRFPVGLVAEAMEEKGRKVATMRLCRGYLVLS